MNSLSFDAFTASQLQSWYDFGYAIGQLDARNYNVYDTTRVGQCSDEALYKMACDGYHFGYSDTEKK